MITQHIESMEVQVDPTPALQLHGTSRTDSASIAAAVSAAFDKMGEFMGRRRIAPVGPPRIIYTTWNDTESRFTLAFPIASPLPEIGPDEVVSAAILPGTRALRFEHVGPYETLRNTYARIDAWLKEHKAIEGQSDWQRYMPMWEECINDPQTTPASELVTRIYLPLS
jgi:effector-binding domain-containing protein